MTKCSFEGCDKEILPNWKQHAAEGFIYWTDENSPNKTFVHRHNLEGWKGGSKHGSNGKVDTSELSKAVLSELRDLQATEAQVQIAKQLLRLATAKGSAAVGALDRLSIRLGDNFSARRPGAKEKCSVCGRRPSGDIVITMSPLVEEEQRILTQQLKAEIAAKKRDEDVE